jgi:hypothetical protein
MAAFTSGSDQTELGRSALAGRLRLLYVDARPGRGPWRRVLLAALSLFVAFGFVFSVVMSIVRKQARGTAWVIWPLPALGAIGLVGAAVGQPLGRRLLAVLDSYWSARRSCG